MKSLQFNVSEGTLWKSLQRPVILDFHLSGHVTLLSLSFLTCEMELLIPALSMCARPHKQKCRGRSCSRNIRHDLNTQGLNGHQGPQGGPVCGLSQNIDNQAPLLLKEYDASPCGTSERPGRDRPEVGQGPKQTCHPHFLAGS